jgi:hypothetical protein
MQFEIRKYLSSVKHCVVCNLNQMHNIVICMAVSK